MSEAEISVRHHFSPSSFHLTSKCHWTQYSGRSLRTASSQYILTCFSAVEQPCWENGGHLKKNRSVQSRTFRWLGNLEHIVVISKICINTTLVLQHLNGDSQDLSWGLCPREHKNENSKEKKPCGEFFFHHQSHRGEVLHSVTWAHLNRTSWVGLGGCAGRKGHLLPLAAARSTIAW